MDTDWQGAFMVRFIGSVDIETIEVDYAQVDSMGHPIFLRNASSGCIWPWTSIVAIQPANPRDTQIGELYGPMDRRAAAGDERL